MWLLVFCCTGIRVGQLSGMDFMGFFLGWLYILLCRLVGPFGGFGKETNQKSKDKGESISQLLRFYETKGK